MCPAKRRSSVGIPGVLVGRRTSNAKPYLDRKTGKWMFKARLPSGTWKAHRTRFTEPEYELAVELQREVQSRFDAEAEAAVTSLPDSHAKGGALQTVFTFSKVFLADRPTSADHDETRLRLHVFPLIGGMALRDVQARHVLEVMKVCEKKLAPRTVLNVYSVLSALFREACIKGLVGGSPCILSRHTHLPSPRDKNPAWRAQNSYTREEVELITSPHPFIEVDSMVGYSILAFTGMRLDEVATLRWKGHEPVWYGAGGSVSDKKKTLCLGRLVLVDTKTGDPRYVPIHPELAPVLDAWKEWGWRRYTGRAPLPEDPIIPLIPGPRARQDERTSRSLDTFKSRMTAHRDALGWRRGRAIHTFRHTFISMARGDGADRDVLRRATHKVPSDVMSLYTRVEWSRLCEEVAKLDLKRDVRLGVLGTWDRSDSWFPAPKDAQVGPGRKRIGRYVKGQRPVDRFGNLVTRGYVAPADRRVDARGASDRAAGRARAMRAGDSSSAAGVRLSDGQERLGTSPCRTVRA